MDEMTGQYYILLRVEDRPGVLAEIADVFGAQRRLDQERVAGGVRGRRAAGVHHAPYAARARSRRRSAAPRPPGVEEISQRPCASRPRSDDGADRGAASSRSTATGCRSATRRRSSRFEEGGTPLVRSEALSAETGCEVFLKFEGANPTGSFKDREDDASRSARRSRRARRRSCAPPPATRRASAAAYAGKAGLTCAVLVPKGRSRPGRWPQTLVHGARVLEVDGNFDARRSSSRGGLAERYPVTLVNSVNPYRLQGRRRAAFEIADALGRAPDVHCVAGRQRREHLEPLDGLLRVPGRRHDPRAATAVRVPGERGRAASSAVIRWRIPQTIASAIRIGNPASWDLAIAAASESEGAILRGDRPTTSSTPTGGSRARVCSRSRRRAASVAGLLQLAKDGRAPARRNGGLRAHRSRARGPRVGDQRGAASIAVPAEPTPSRPSSGCRRAPHRDRPGDVSANLGPGFDCFGLALDLLQRGDAGAPRREPGVDVGGRGRGGAADRRDPTWCRAVAETAARFERAAGGRAIRADNRIPLERGLGSSAAAAARRRRPRRRGARSRSGPDRDLEVAAGLEGHPRQRGRRRVRRVHDRGGRGRRGRFDPDPELRPALFVLLGPARSPTEAARRVLPDRRPARGRCRERGITRRSWRSPSCTNPTCSPAAMRDRCTRTIRLGLVLEMREVFERVRGAGLAVCVSGSGPTLLAFERHDVITPEPGGGWRGSCACRCAPAGVDIAKAEGAYHLRRWWSDDRTEARPDPGPRPTRRRTRRSASSHPPPPSEAGSDPGPGHRSREQDAGRQGGGDLPVLRTSREPRPRRAGRSRAVLARHAVPVALPSERERARSRAALVLGRTRLPSPTST